MLVAVKKHKRIIAPVRHLNTYKISFSAKKKAFPKILRVHPCRLIRVCAVCLKTLWILGYPQSASKDCDQTTDVQADLSLRWMHIQSCKICCAPAQIMRLMNFLTLLLLNMICFVCVEVLWPSQPNGVMLSAVSLPNHTFTGQA